MKTNEEVRITLFDERYYKVEEHYYPSVTWILQSFPKDIFFHKWLANSGWEEAERMKDEGADRGSKVHNAIQDLLEGATLTYRTPYYSQMAQDNVALSDNEWKHLMTFKAWWDKAGLKLFTTEFVVYSKTYSYAGTLDGIFVTGEPKGTFMLHVADWKTSSAIFPTYRMQVAAYVMALIEMFPQLKGILIQGIIVRTNTRHAAGYESVEMGFDQLEEEFKNFLAVKNVWSIEHGEKSPVNREIPQTLSITVEREEINL